MAKGAKHHRSSKAESSMDGKPFMMLLAFLLLFTMVLLGLHVLEILSLPIDAAPKKSSLDVSDLSSLKFQADLHRRKSLSLYYLYVSLMTWMLYLSVRRDSENQRTQWIEVLSWEPRAFIYHNFLTKDECEYLISLAKPHMQKSTVVDTTTGKSKDSRVRTSSGMFLKRGQDKIIQSIEQKIADFTFIPVENGEGLQVLHYEVGQKYEPHFDYFVDEFNTKNGGQRIATVLMYLTDVEEGGETVFPSVKVNESSIANWNELSECGKTGLVVRPKMGDALLFWSMKPDSTLDPMSLHAGCPVIKGNKWSSTKWMHVNEFK